jgi:hypothetical protein
MPADERIVERPSLEHHLRQLVAEIVAMLVAVERRGQRGIERPAIASVPIASAGCAASHVPSKTISPPARNGTVS